MESSLENKRLSIDDFKIIKTLGTGSFGRVKLAQHKKNNKVYAIKILRKHEIIKSKQIDHIFSEYNILRQLNHPFIVEFKGLIKLDPKFLYFIQEFIGGGELFNLLRTLGNFSLRQAKFYSSQIVTVFEYLHSKDIIYRDLKPENILITGNGYIKLIDFGFSKIVEGKEKTYTLCGTPEYLAPEIILNKGHGKPVDWWTLGILLYEMLVGIDPFNDDDPMMIYQKIIKGNFKFPSTIDKDAKSLIRHLLCIDVTKRYGCLKSGIKDIVDHRFFKEFNWRGLLYMNLESPYVPKLQDELDTTHFFDYPDSEEELIGIKPEKDPFLNW